MFFVILLIALCFFLFFFNDTATTEIYTLSLHDALPISFGVTIGAYVPYLGLGEAFNTAVLSDIKYLIPYFLSISSNSRSEEHTSELQSRQYLVCRLLLEKKKKLLYIIHLFKTPNS